MNQQDNNMSKTVRKVKLGRPETRPWLLEKPTIEFLIQSGLGLTPLAKHYGMTQPGMRKILQRLGLQTHYQEARSNEVPRNVGEQGS